MKKTLTYNKTVVIEKKVWYAETPSVQFSVTIESKSSAGSRKSSASTNVTHENIAPKVKEPNSLRLSSNEITPCNSQVPVISNVEVVRIVKDRLSDRINLVI